LEFRKGKLLPPLNDTLSHNPFKDIKLDPGKLPRTVKIQPRTKIKDAPSKSDEELFSEAVADVREIKEFREIARPHPPRSPAVPHQTNISSFFFLNCSP
jgi:hypothetical protein